MTTGESSMEVSEIHGLAADTAITKLKDVAVMAKEQFGMTSDLGREKSSAFRQEASVEPQKAEDLIDDCFAMGSLMEETQSRGHKLPNRKLVYSKSNGWMDAVAVDSTKTTGQPEGLRIGLYVERDTDAISMSFFEDDTYALTVIPIDENGEYHEDIAYLSGRRLIKEINPDEYMVASYFIHEAMISLSVPGQ